MQRIPVESSDIVAIGYDPKSRVLEIEFKEDRLYQYLDVEPDVYEKFMRAESYGQYFFASISRHYRYRRAREDKNIQDRARTLVFVTSNEQKLQGLRRACEPFGIDVEQLSLPVDEIQSHDVQKIAMHKAKQAYKLAGRPVVVQDTFWNILALKGFPGAYMRYVAEWFKPEDFLALMQDKADRTVGRTHILVYYDGKRAKVFAKDYWGKITDEPHGKGLSIDQVVITDGQTKTNAEIWEAENHSAIPLQDSVWHEFAKWFSLQRRLKLV
ncbi:MAG TPA: non-canonical purine NTP pyrophosphatase [Nevskiaceae bacterium]|nr:non-canonical purine NTP pyrophosphatase [Nevskiaceae bacterium]